MYTSYNPDIFFPSLQINPEHEKPVAHRGRRIQKPSKAEILVRKKERVLFLFCFSSLYKNRQIKGNKAKKVYMHYSTPGIHT